MERDTIGIKLVPTKPLIKSSPSNENATSDFEKKTIA